MKVLKTIGIAILSFISFVGGILFYAKVIDKPETVINNNTTNETKIGKIKAKQGAVINSEIDQEAAAPVKVKLGDRIHAKRQKRRAQKAQKQ